MEFGKNLPKCSPKCSAKLKHNLNRRKNSAKMWSTFVIKKLSKVNYHVCNARKFAQFGHPAHSRFVNPKLGKAGCFAVKDDFLVQTKNGLAYQKQFSRKKGVRQDVECHETDERLGKKPEKDSTETSENGMITTF
jgi:hypothetical protein